MTKEEYLELAASKYESISKLQEHKNFYDYEEAFDELWVDLGRSVLEQSIGTVPKDAKKKLHKKPIRYYFSKKESFV